MMVGGWAVFSVMGGGVMVGALIVIIGLVGGEILVCRPKTCQAGIG